MLRLQDVFFKPFTKFLQLQASGSILLLGATIIALVWANSPWAEIYHGFWHSPIVLSLGPYSFERTLHFWINDALMTIFFLVVGLEIKRELLVGELSSPRQAALPIAAAIGGMLAPAAVYFVINPPGSAFARGWGIPTVTDIAFAIGVLTILGGRVPMGLKVFLTALAIVDDVGAILLIALFYSGGLQVAYLVMAGSILAILAIFNRTQQDSPVLYLSIGILLWLAILNSGLHPTIAGVLLAFTIPAKGRIDPEVFYYQGQSLLERFSMAGMPADKRIILTNPEHQASVQALESLCEEVQAPLQQIEHTFHPWVSYLILPLFALANAGVHINPATLGEALTHPITLAVVLGLFFGKQLGITLFAWLSVRLRIAELPAGVGWSGIYGASILGGIGFTVAIFISVLAFTPPEQTESAKLGVLLGSLISGLVGIIVLRRALQSPQSATEDEPS